MAGQATRPKHPESPATSLARLGTSGALDTISQGGGIYLKPDQAKGRKDSETCDSVYHWVEDMFWPEGAGPMGTDRDKLEKNWGKADEIDRGNIDIGKRLPETRKSKWYCGEQAQFLAWLLRRLGYKVQYKNIVPSTAESKSPDDIVVTMQTAALNVWYAGSWSLYDPFESFMEADGGLDAYVKKKGDCAAPYSDAYVYIWQKGDHDGFTWDARLHPGSESNLVEEMKKDGWTRHKYVLKSAGSTFRNTREEIRIGLKSGEAMCGWSGEVHETWTGARYRPFGRPIAPSMGSPDWQPAKDERVEPNVLVETTLAMTLIVTKPISPNNVLRRWIWPACQAADLQRAT